MEYELFKRVGYEIYPLTDPSFDAICEMIESSDRESQTHIEYEHSFRHLHIHLPEQSLNYDYHQAPIEIYSTPGINTNISDLCFFRELEIEKNYDLVPPNHIEPIETLNPKHGYSASIDFDYEGYFYYENYNDFFNSEFVTDYFEASKKTISKQEQYLYQLIQEYPHSFFVSSAQTGLPIRVKDIIQGIKNVGIKPSLPFQVGVSDKNLIAYNEPSYLDRKKNYMSHQYTSVSVSQSQDDLLAELAHYNKKLGLEKREFFFYQIKNIDVKNVFDTNLYTDGNGLPQKRYPHAGYVMQKNGEFFIIPGQEGFYNKEHLLDGTLSKDQLIDLDQTKRERFFPRQIFSIHADMTLYNPVSKKEYTLRDIYIPGAVFVDSQ